MVTHFRWITLVAAALLSACAGAPQGAMEQDEGPHPVWPPAGQTPRIIHRRNIRGLQVAQQRGLLDLIAGAIAGPRRQQLLRPQSVAVSPDDQTLYIVDQELQGVHILQNGKGRFVDRTDRATYFVSPVAIAWCDGALAVSDSALNQVVMLTPDGKPIRTLSKPGGFQRPTGLAYDAQRRRLYVVDTLACSVNVFDAGGALIESFGSQGKLAGEFHYPTYAAVDGQGNLYVTDSLNFRVQVFSPQGKYLYDIGELGNTSGHLAVPKGVGVDAFGHIYIVDSYFSAVQIFDDEGQLLLSFGDVGRDNGQFHVPTGLLVTPDNFIYVCDAHNSRVQVFEYVGGSDNE